MTCSSSLAGTLWSIKSKDRRKFLGGCRGVMSAIMWPEATSNAAYRLVVGCRRSSWCAARSTGGQRKDCSGSLEPERPPVRLTDMRNRAPFLSQPLDGVLAADLCSLWSGEQAFATRRVLTVFAAVARWRGRVSAPPNTTHTHRVIGTAVRRCPRSRQSGGALVASREHVRCVPRSARRQPRHHRCWVCRHCLLWKRSPPVIATHAYCMAWSYAGLVAAVWVLAAAVGQVTGRGGAGRDRHAGPYQRVVILVRVPANA